MFTAWRRRRILARQQIAEPLWQATLAALPFLDYLNDEERARLRDLTVLFLAEKEMHGAAGLTLSDEIRLSIAVQACLPILNLGLDFYKGWVGIIVYPGGFAVTREEVDEHGVVHRWRDALSGEAWSKGPVVLSWEDAHPGAGASNRPAGYNVVIHEFAHKLDMRHKPEADGYPVPHRHMDPELWRTTLQLSYEHFCEAADRGVAHAPAGQEPPAVDEWGRILPFDVYAAEHPAEFFAVMSESFFTEAATQQLCYPELYQQLTLYYRQDPAARAAPADL